MTNPLPPADVQALLGHLEGPNGAPVGAAHAAFWPTGTGPEARPRRIASQDSTLTFFSPWPTVDVEVQASGYRPTELKAVRAGCRVLLSEGIPLTLTLAPEVELPEPPLVLRVFLVPEHSWRRTFEENIVAEDSSWSNQWFSWLQQFAPVFDASRRVNLQLPGPGTYVVEWQVAEDSINSRVGPHRIPSKKVSQQLLVHEEDAGRLVELSPDVEALREAIAKLSTTR